MAVYCISYTLKSGDNNNLIEAIKAHGNWWHNSDSVWFIESNNSAQQILETLRNHILSVDKILVIEVKKHWYAMGYKDDEYQWLKQRNFL